MGKIRGAPAIALLLLCGAGEARMPHEAVSLYNEACEHSLDGDLDAAARSLLEAVKAGFTDFPHMRRDRDLRSLRGHAVYRAIVAARLAADDMLAARALTRWRGRLDGEYRADTDGRNRLKFLSALDDEAHAAMRRMLEDQAAAMQSLFSVATASPAARPTWAIVVLPGAQDAAELLDDPHARGVYRHRRGELICTDPGRSLRHEFVHVMHHRQMDALGQQHPLWIQEGLACLWERWRPGEAGAVVFEANDRDRLARAAAEQLAPWTAVIALDAAGLREGAAWLYPQLRSMLRFIADSGRLETWYAAYVDGFDDDPSGAAALEAVFGTPLAEIERRWRARVARTAVPRSGGDVRADGPGGS